MTRSKRSKATRLTNFRPLPSGHNPNAHNAFGLGLLDDSMSEDGYVAPMTAAADGTVLDGNARLEVSATVFDGVEPIVVEHDGTRPVVMVRTDIPDASAPAAKRIIVSANRIAEANLAWDAAVLKTMELEGVELSKLWGQDELATLLGTEPKVGKTDPDDVPEPRATAIQRGDLFELGPHRLLCGDSTTPADVARLLGNVKPILMVTDPPYGVAYDPTWRAEAGVNKNRSKLGGVSNDDRVDWSPAWALFPGDVAYVWHAGLHAAEVQASLESAGLRVRSQIIWAKDRFALSRGDYHWHHEPCWYAVRVGGTGHWGGDRSQSTLWSIAAREDSGHGHGTQKPVECMARAIRNHEAPEVYEPFSGSGTTIVACEQYGRRCLAIEIEPSYVQVAIDRWEAFVGNGQKAVKVGEAVRA